MKYYKNRIWLTVLMIGAASMGLSACSEEEQTSENVASAFPNVALAPVFNDAGDLVQPVDFREWTFIGTPITPNGLNAGAANFPEYHNVYVQPEAFDHYRETGEWPEGTTLVKELQLVKGGGDFEDGSRLEVSGRGYFPAAVNGIDVSVKDSDRFGDTDNWGYFNFGHHAPPYAASAPAMPKEACAQCHIDNAHEDMVYVDFYRSILTPLQTTAEATEYPDIDVPPVFNDAGELVQPVDFREWIFIGTPITPNGLNNEAANFPEYHNVYVQPAAFDHYRETGGWPEGTTLVKELQLVKGGSEFDDGSRNEVSGRGYFPAAVNGIDVSVKDSKRFSDTDNWGYFNFGHHAPPYAASALAMPKEACAQCHIDNAHEDMVYVDFYESILTPLQTALTPLQTAAAQSIADSSDFSLYVDTEGNISLPPDFATDWSHLGSWAVAADGGVEGIHNVYAPKSDVEYFRANGKFADGAIMVKEVLSARGAAHTTGDAHWADETQVWFIMVKDTVGRFADNPLWGEGWGWALYEGKDPSKQVATDYKVDCLGCHVPAKDTDWTYVYGYPILGTDVAQNAPGQETAATAAADAMTSMAAASDDTQEGKEIFARCAGCHSLTPGQNGIGPSLSGVVGRKAGSGEGYNYSEAMQNSEVVWSAETLSSHLADVPGFIPDNRMASLFPAGVQDSDERDKVIAYIIDASSP